MALPPGAKEFGDLPYRSGIVLGIGLSSDYSFNVEIERATSSGVFFLADTLTAMSLSAFGGKWTDILPPSNKTYLYRARSALPGWQPSTYTGTVSARPTRISVGMPKPIPMGGQGVGASLFFQGSSATVKVGTDRASSYVTKTLKVSHAEFFADQDNTQYAMTDAYLSNRSSTATELYAAVLLPAGVTLTRQEVTAWKNGAPDTITVRLIRVASTVATILSTEAYTGGSGLFTFASTYNELTSTSRSYVVRATLTGSTNGATRVYSITYQYRMPDYRKGV